MLSHAFARPETVIRFDGSRQGRPAVRGSTLAGKAVYGVSYALGFGLIYPTILATRIVPMGAPVVHGLIDGGLAARNAMRDR